jgi:hypothetical protein
MTEEEENEILARAEEVKRQRNARYLEKAKAVALRLKNGTAFEEPELIYAAFARCDCGAGYAYPKECGFGGYWECSEILKRTHNKEAKHSPQLPFSFYEVKSEDQPSARGATTRPK